MRALSALIVEDVNSSCTRRDEQRQRERPLRACDAELGADQPREGECEREPESAGHPHRGEDAHRRGGVEDTADDARQRVVHGQLQRSRVVAVLGEVERIEQRGVARRHRKAGAVDAGAREGAHRRLAQAITLRNDLEPTGLDRVVDVLELVDRRVLSGTPG